MLTSASSCCARCRRPVRIRPVEVVARELRDACKAAGHMAWLRLRSNDDFRTLHQVQQADALMREELDLLRWHVRGLANELLPVKLIGSPDSPRGCVFCASVVHLRADIADAPRPLSEVPHAS